MRNNIITFTKIFSIFIILIISCNRGIDNDMPVANLTETESIGNENKETEKIKQKEDNDVQDKQDKVNIKSDDGNKVRKPFITVWKVGKVVDFTPVDKFFDEDRSFSIPVDDNFKNTYKFDLKWSRVDNPEISGEKLNMHARMSDRYDGRHQIAVDSLPGPGEYVVEITGIFPAIRFGNSYNTRTDQIIEVRQWGDIEWWNMERAFYGCKNLHITAKDAPDLSRVRDMSYMFYRAALLNEYIGHWDVSNVTNMASMFEKAKSFNQSLNNWDVSNVTNMNSMFREAVSFGKSIENWNVSKVKDMGSMFYGTMVFDEPLDMWDVSNVTNMASMFERAEMFNQSLNSWIINSKTTDLSRIFKGARYFDKSNISNWKISDDFF